MLFAPVRLRLGLLRPLPVWGARPIVPVSFVPALALCRLRRLVRFDSMVARRVGLWFHALAVWTTTGGDERSEQPLYVLVGVTTTHRCHLR